jgi:steroid delta-isomerase-like uncharacterized protein
LLDRFYSAYNDHHLKAAMALYGDHPSHHEVAQGRRASGVEEIGAGLAGFWAAFPDARWTERRRVVGVDAAAVTYRLTGTLAAPMGPFRTLGQSLDLEGVHVFDVADGRISSSADYWDAASFARQMKGGG